MRFHVIGENLKKVPTKFKKNSGIKWKNFQWFRNLISHEYVTVYPEVVRDLIKTEIPKLKKEIKIIKKKIK
jgi:uncharacterized protein with HEPN domain